MGWVRLDDGFAEDPVIANLSNDAFALWVSGIAYCNRRLTDGFIPLQVGYGQLRYCDGNAATFARELEECGRWIREQGGWRIHHYLDWQRSKETILGERESTKERVYRFRSSDDNGVQNDVSNAVGHGSKEPQPKPQYFEKFYRSYPRHVGKRAAERAFASATKRADPKAIIEGAARFAADPNLPETTFVPYPATWLNRDGWEDDPLPKRNGRKTDVSALALRKIAERKRG
jgi:hypothetical protein